MWLMKLAFGLRAVVGSVALAFAAGVEKVSPSGIAGASTSERPVHRAARRVLPDLFGVLIAAVYALPTLSYVHGRDLALFHYMGREFLSGTLPYRDAFDTKTPGIYLLHAALIALFGSELHVIRVAEVAAVLAIGCIAASCVRRSCPRRPGELGLCAMLASSFYFTVHDYWDTGQVEIWESLLLLAAYCVLERDRHVVRGAFVSGLLCGVALLFKPTAGTVVLVLALSLARRAYVELHDAARRERMLQSARALAWYGLGSGLVLGSVFAFYAAKGALGSLRDLYEYLQIYATVWSERDPLGKIAYYGRVVAPWALATAGGWGFALATARRRGEREVAWGVQFAVLLALAAFASVVVQRKYFHYHWAIMTPFVVLAGAYGVAALARVHVAAAWGATTGVLIVGFLLAPTWSRNPELTYRSYAVDVWYPWMRGHIGENTFARSLTDDADYSWADQRNIARRIRNLARPGDRLHVRGFEFGIYVLSGLSTPARVVNEILLDENELSDHYAHWAAAHEEALFHALPRFFVTFINRDWDHEKLREHGYKQSKRAGIFVLFVRKTRPRRSAPSRSVRKRGSLTTLRRPLNRRVGTRSFGAA